MSCCAPGAELDLHNAGPSADEIRLASKIVGDEMRRSDLSVPTCIAAPACTRSRRR